MSLTLMQFLQWMRTFLKYLSHVSQRYLFLVKDNSHYEKYSLRPTDVADSWGLNRYLFTAIKYIQRRGQKEGCSYHGDLAKAIWYLAKEFTGSDDAAEEIKKAVWRLKELVELDDESSSTSRENHP